MPATRRMFYRFLSLLFLTFGMASLPSSARNAAAHDYNALVLEAIGVMPQGGGYAVTREAALRLRTAVNLDHGGSTLRVTPRGATPSYCSGATYLVFLEVLKTLQAKGQLQLSPEVLSALLITGQPDGVGIWGRWNANGPGTARLFHELKLGPNFEEYAKARPGDFMKIFWTKEVGKRERGHSVVYLGHGVRDGVEVVRFWSSNQPDGYGVKEVPRSKVAYTLFSRLEQPGRIAGAAKLPKSDPYLASLLKVVSSIPEAKAKSGVR